MSDDGAGVHTIRALQKLKLPDTIELLDSGTATMSYLTNLSDRKKVIIIDAVKAGNPPGTLYRFTPDDIYIQKERATSLHQIGIIEAIVSARFIGACAQDIVVYGIEPGKIESGMMLTPDVAAALPKLVEKICQDLELAITDC